jgi:serine/threonine protein kinase
MSNAPKDPQGIFLAALDIPDPAGRAMFVEKACDGDALLRQRVENLLGAYGEPDGPLENMAAALAPTQLGAPIHEQAGTMIGRYKLIELIGEGAMGSVWMAQQTEPVKRLVAIKLIKAGADSKTVLTRFEAERQALALMDHPNIAKVFDGGVSESGSPYFAMELVKGVPITRYCDERKLTPRERLALFVPVCQAVQHAHQKGVIHRDLKPTNVLVAQYDGRAVPKVIDFGVAKAVGHRSLPVEPLSCAGHCPSPRSLARRRAVAP